MTQHDWVGAETLADQKARLHLRLHKLCQYCPEKVRSGEVYRTREWVQRQASAKSVAAKAHASVNDLTVAITSLEGYLSPAELARFAL